MTTPYTHLCISTDTVGAPVYIRHISEFHAILDQILRERAGHTDVVVMPVATEELADYPQPDATTATKSKHDTRAKVNA